MKPKSFGKRGHVDKMIIYLSRGVWDRTRHGICRFCNSGVTVRMRDYPFDCPKCHEPSGLLERKYKGAWKKPKVCR